MATDSTHLPASVLALVREQSGVVRRTQLHQRGVHPRTLHRRIAAGLWEVRGKHVLVFAGTAPGPLTEALVAGHALHGRGVLTGYSALAVTGQMQQDPWSAIDPPDLPWIRSEAYARVGARLLRARPGPWRALLGVRVAPPDQVVVDLARFLPGGDARTLMYRIAQRRGSASLAGLLATAAAAAPGRSGNEQLRRLVAELGTGAHSDAEHLLLRILADAGITGFVVNYPVRIGQRVVRIDVAFPGSKVAIEVDGRAFHSSGSRFQGDRTRQNLIVGVGWRVLRFTWEDLTERPDRVVELILAMLAA
jgi:very-short-patch-repair endonuclease